MNFLPILTAAACCLAISLVLNRLMLSLAPRLGLMDQPGERRIHVSPIPRAGGLAIWLSFMTVITVGLAAGWLAESSQLSWNWLMAFGAGSGILIVAGIIDDHRGLSPWIKLGSHFLAPTVFFLLRPMNSGFFPAGWHWLCDALLFIAWAVVLINAFNLIDGLDGLCGGLAVVATAALGALALINGSAGSALLLFAMAAAIVGFLKYNLNPARIFLGDAGSMLMGFFLATVATEAVGRKAVAGMILLPIAVAGVPLLDVLLAIWRRGARRLAMKLRGEEISGGIFSADSDHLHHRLLQAGGSQKAVAVKLQIIAAVLAVLAFLPLFFGDRLFGLSIVGFLVVALAGLRNLTRVELQHTGSVIHMAIKLPGHRRRVAAALFVYDVGVLLLASAAAILIETNLMMRGADPMHLAKFTVIFVTVGSLALLMAKVHQRLWVRATLRDLLSLQFWLIVAAGGSFVLFCLMDSSVEWSAMRIAVMAFVFACVAICVPRVSMQLMRELALEARHRSPSTPTAGGGFGTVVVLGAGDLGSLFHAHLKSSSHDIYPQMRVLGYLDETRVLHGRRLRSFTVLGGLSLVPKLVEEEGLTGIVVAIHRPRQGLLDQLQVLAEQHGLKIYRWNVLLDESDWSAEAAPEVTKEVVAAPVHAPVKVAAAELSGVA